MQVSTITISTENVVELAKSTISPKQCDWLLGGREVCPVVLGSWELLKEHYLRHCHLQGKQDSGATCSLPRCNVRTHASVQMLQEHVKSAHLPRITLPCPIYDCCTSKSGYRPSQMEDHFVQAHGQLNGVTANSHSGILRPTWQPFCPSQGFPVPPPLPESPPPGQVLIQTVSTTFRKDEQLLVSPSPLLISPSASPHKSAVRQIPETTHEKKGKGSAENDSFVELELPAFEDLPRVQFSEDGSFKFQELVIWQRPNFLAVDVSRPQPMQDRPIRDPPLSILYEEFARRVDALDRSM